MLAVDIACTRILPNDAPALERKASQGSRAMSQYMRTYRKRSRVAVSFLLACETIDSDLLALYRSRVLSLPALAGLPFPPFHGTVALLCT